MRFVGVGMVFAYRYTLAPLLASLGGAAPGIGCCKFHPTCSRYAIDALREYGLLRGSVLAAWRLARCHPWSHGGVDRVDAQRLFRKPA